MKKIRVRIVSERRENGEEVPRRIRWEDGREWEIDRVLHSCCSCDGEFEGIRYTVMIGHSEKYIYKNSHEWYVMV